MTRQLCAAIVLAGAMLSGAPRAAIANDFTFDTPSDDRWHYTFNFTPGVRAIGACFGAADNLEFPEFNDRDAYVLLAWATDALIEPGMGPDAYDIQSITVTLTNQAQAEWPIDLTVDAWFTFDIDGDGVVNGDGIPRGDPGDQDGESTDDDPGRPIELFGVGFGPTLTFDTWTETTVYIGSTCDLFGNCTSMARDPFPFVFQHDTLDPLHCEDNVSGLWNDGADPPVFSFTPVPWALGVPIDYTPGDQPVPFDVTFQLDLSMSGGAVRGYFQDQLNAGRVVVAVTSLFDTSIMAPENGFPSFFMKEGLFLDPGAKAAQLRIVMAAAVHGDFDGDGAVDLGDYTALSACLSGPDRVPDPAPPTTAAACLRVFDGDGDGDVDLVDVGDFQTVFTGP